MSKDSLKLWVIIGSPIILTIIFIVLQITKIITWSWLWVLSPLWISAGLIAITLVVVLIFGRVIMKDDYMHDEDMWY